MVGKRLENFWFHLHLREPNEEDFHTVSIKAILRLDLAPDNIALLKFYVKQCRGDADYIFSLKWEKEAEDAGAWRAMLGRSRANGLDHENFTDTNMRIKMPADKNDLMEGVGTLALRVTLDSVGFVDVFMVLGTSKDQIVRKGDTIIGYVENYKDVVDFFSMVDTTEKRESFGRAHLEDVEVDATLEFVDNA